MFTELNDAKAEQDVTITADALAQPVANMNAGVLNLKLYAFEGRRGRNRGVLGSAGPG